jgi:hypothetical protein
MFATICAVVGGFGGVAAVCEKTMDAISAASTIPECDLPFP